MHTRDIRGGSSFWSVVRRDLQVVGSELSAIALLKKLWVDPGFSAVFHYRLGARLRRSNGFGRLLAKMLWKKIIFNNGSYISLLADIGPGFRLPHAVGIVIGDGVRIGSNVTVFQNVTLGSGRPVNNASYPVLGDNVTVFAGAVIVGGVVLGNGVVVGANAVVIHSFHDNSVLVGMPARQVQPEGSVRQ